MIPGLPRPTAPKTKYKALHNWESQSPYELVFKAGEIIELVDGYEGNTQYEGWWYGRIDTEEGWFPASYVEEVKIVPVNIVNRPVSDVISRLQQQCGFFESGKVGDSVVQLSNDFTELQATIQASTTKTLEELGRDSTNKNNMRGQPLDANELQALKKELMDLKRKLLEEAEEKKILKAQLEKMVYPDKEDETLKLITEMEELKKHNQVLINDYNSKEDECNKLADQLYDLKEKMELGVSNLEEHQERISQLEVFLMPWYLHLVTLYPVGSSQRTETISTTSHQ
eukprot:TRINITY_DN13109_c0_g1_i1.p1 TRINITY_DN13109_c0_g1~~TRINITY_DN13109_c0_g1_i1.p1  ORF type:complete len:284 (-),score=59.87 TRINITY_DN13109_c0_g1_i1:276-1127(-)